MRHLYQEKYTDTITAGHSKRVYSDPVPAGYVLFVHCCYVYAPNRNPWDKTLILVDWVGEELVVRCRAEDVRQCGISTYRPFYVGEHRRIIGYTPDAAIGDSISLNIIGELTPLKKWRKGGY